MRRRYGNFAGGIDLAEDKRTALLAPVSPTPTPRRLLLPLTWGDSPLGECLVSVGQDVDSGETIARGSGAGILAPLAGTVSGMTFASVAGRNLFLRVPAIELTDLSAPESLDGAKPTWDWAAADALEIRRRLDASQLTTYRRGGGSLAEWIASARCSKTPVRTLVANCMESQPCVAADHRLLVERGTEVIRGLVILARALEAAEVMLVVDHRHTDAYRNVIGPCRLYDIKAVAMDHKYPTGVDEILIKILFRREVPIGKTPLDIGLPVVSAACCWATYRSVACDAPPLARVVTVGGDRANACGNFYVPFGTSCRELAGGSESQIIHGGPMSGITCPDDAIVGPQTEALLSVSPPEIAAPGPCIRCGWCTDYCPARLNVAAINDMYELGQLDRAERSGARACVECGVCTYVCPARLPLSQRVRRLKQALVKATSAKEAP